MIQETRGGQEQGVNPLQLARDDARTELDAEYTPGNSQRKIKSLQSVLIDSGLPAENVYSELILTSTQHRDRARKNKDKASTTELEDLRRSYESTYKVFAKTGEPTPAVPSQTARMPMGDPKGPSAASSRSRSTRTRR